MQAKVLVGLGDVLVAQVGGVHQGVEVEVVLPTEVLNVVLDRLSSDVVDECPQFGHSARMFLPAEPKVLSHRTVLLVASEPPRDGAERLYS